MYVIDDPSKLGVIDEIGRNNEATIDDDEEDEERVGARITYTYAHTLSYLHFLIHTHIAFRTTQQQQQHHAAAPTNPISRC